MEQFREIERKFRAAESYELVCSDLNKMFRFATITNFDSEDFFFKGSYLSPQVGQLMSEVQRGFDFIRLRTNEHWAEITGKLKDRLTNLNRLEVNVPVKPEGIVAALKFCRQAFGAEQAVLRKKVRVWKLRGGLEVAAYIVGEDNAVYVEVEGQSMEDVDAITGPLARLGYLETETRSLFEMYVEGKQ